MTTERTNKAANAFGEADEWVSAHQHKIRYEGKDYEPDEFFTAYFPEYKKFPKRVKFLGQAAKDVLRLSTNQRNRLQYDILAKKLGLVDVAEQDAQEIEAFFRSGDNLTAARIAHKMGYPDGVRKIITFGCGLKMDGKYPGVWCYKVHREENQCTYEGVPMTWEQWGQEVAKTIDLCRTNRAMRLYGLELQDYLKRDPEELDGFMSTLYYSDHKYMTLPPAEKEQLERWVHQYVRLSVQEYNEYYADHAAKPPLLFPLHGDTGSDEYSFTIDFDKDVEIVPNVSWKRNAAEYNAEQNAAKGKQRVEQRASATLPDGDFTRDDLAALGYGPKAISNLRRDKLIVDTGRRTPERKFIFRKNFV